MDNSINARYNTELNNINHLLNQLASKRIYEFSQNRGDGSLSFNIEKLTKLLNDLLNKIENDLPSSDDKLKEAFDKFSLDKIVKED